MYYLLLALAVLTLLVYKYVTWNNDFWKKRGVPHEEPEFFFGNLKKQFTGKQHFGQICQDIYNNYNENVRYVGFMKLLQPSLLLRDPDLIKDVMSKDFSSFSNNDFQVDPNLDPLIYNNPFAQKDEARWRRTRGHFTPAVTNSKIKLYFSGMEEICNIMIDDIKQQIRKNGIVDFEGKKLSGKYATDIIAKAVFGVDNNTFEDEQSLFFRIATSFFGSSFLDNIKLYIVLLVPKLASTLRMRVIAKDVQEKIIKMTKDIIAHRQQSGIKRNDFFQQMITYRENDTQNEFTDIYIASHAFEFIVDGYETSSTTISYILLELAWNQDVQDRLREEINVSMKETNGRLSFDHINAIKYLDRIISESLRINPPALVLTRVCTKDYEFPPPKPGGKPLKMKVGESVTIPVYALHRDAMYYPKPEKFNPDNFTEEAIASRHKFSYLPFGEGPRICPGFRFALTQIKAAIVGIVYNFKINTSPKSFYPPEIDPNNFIMKPKNDAWVQLEEIKK